MIGRIAALYDIHANLPALEAVLQEIRGSDIDLVVIGGDVVPGPMPRETIQCLLNLNVAAKFIQGNGDREVLANRRGIESSSVPENFRETLRWSARQLDAEADDFLRSWPHTFRAEVSGLGDVLFCHATPRSDTEIFTRFTPEERLLPVVEKANAAMVVCGHTHMQFDRIVGGVRVVNAGSVGMPFGEAGAYWLLLGPDVQLRRTSYDLAKAAGRIRETGYPQAEEFASRNVLEPPSQEAMLNIFAGVELT